MRVSKGHSAFSRCAVVSPETVTVTYGTALPWEQTLPSSVTETEYLYSNYKSGALEGVSSLTFQSAAWVLQASPRLQAGELLPISTRGRLNV